METPIKLKKCSVKLNRLSFIGVTPAEIQEQILDGRIRRCAVRLQRCSESNMNMPNVGINDDTGHISSIGDHKMRRCCIRLPRLNVSRSDTSSRAGSVTSARILSEVDEREFESMDA